MEQDLVGRCHHTASLHGDSKNRNDWWVACLFTYKFLMPNASGCWWCNGVGNVFLPHYGHLNTNQSWLMHDKVLNINHLRLHLWTWQWVQWTSVASTVTTSLSSRKPLGCGRTGDGQHDCAADKSSEIMWSNPVNMDQNLKEIFPTSCGIQATKNRDCFENKGRLYPVLVWCS